MQVDGGICSDYVFAGTAFWSRYKHTPVFSNKERISVFSKTTQYTKIRCLACAFQPGAILFSRNADNNMIKLIAGEIRISRILVCVGINYCEVTFNSYRS